ncbi:MAG: AAA family ATPase [Promethearchaeota archaeon]
MPTTKSTADSIIKTGSNSIPYHRSSHHSQHPQHSQFSTEYHELEEEIDRIRRREKLLVRKSLSLEMDIQNLQADRDRFQHKFQEAREKISRLSSGAHLVGIVEKVLEHTEDQIIVQVISGQLFVCKKSQNLELAHGDYVSVHQRSMTILEKLPPINTSHAHFQLQDNQNNRNNKNQLSAANFKEIGGLTEEIRQIREVIEFPFTHRDAYQHFNIKVAKGILLHGPPGTGKTLLAKAVAQASNAKFFYLAGSELVKKFIGEGARMIREIFKEAREENNSGEENKDGNEKNNKTPVIIFIDEIDAIAGRRTGDMQSGEREVNRTLLQLLTEMDGFIPNPNVRIIAATNRLDILDPAILRPGRFDRIIELPLPDASARDAIIRIHLSNRPVFRLNFEDLVTRTKGMSGAEIQAICSEAAMIALRKRLENKSRKNILQRDFHVAIQEFNQQKINRQNPNQSNQSNPSNPDLTQGTEIYV